MKTEFGTIVIDYFHMDELAFDLMPGETREVMAGQMIGIRVLRVSGSVRPTHMCTSRSR